MAISALENVTIDLLNATGTSYSEFPKLLTALNNSSLTDFIDLVEQHEKCLMDLLKIKGVNILSYESLNEFVNDVLK